MVVSDVARDAVKIEKMPIPVNIHKTENILPCVDLGVRSP